MGVFYTDEANIIDITTEILRVSGSIVLTGSLITSGSSSISGSFTGSLFGTASYARTASYSTTLGAVLDNTTYSGLNDIYLLASDGTPLSNVIVDNVSSANFATTAQVANEIYTSVIPNSSTDYFIVLKTGSLVSNYPYTSSFKYSPSTNTINVTSSYALTSSYTINSISSSFASTASFTPNALISASVVNGNTIRFERGNTTVFDITIDTGSGGSGTPGGVDTNIQFNSGSVFGGSNKFTYEYDNASQFSNRLYHQYSEDFRSNAFNTDFKGSYLQENTAYANKQLAGISHYQYFLPANSGATRIYVFDAQGGTPGNLSMHGFKCDYSLLLVDGSNNRIASRVGTLIGAWSYDTAITPVIQDTFVDGDQVFNELGTVVFTLVWNFSTIELQMDCTNVNNGDTHFNGLFTNFGNTL